ncbi:MAG TPA: DOPA 4,5-dioxygenase family protein [Kofleriaceae bacterium]|jgi:aromatic ring-cleaving dioxygenase|nr:DOPA 4,5-dioxygenase family protein [Kofleriaceae bacterium]
MRQASEIKGYHAHIYTPDPASREVAARLREALPGVATVQLGRWHDGPIGPHPISMYQVAFEPSELAKIVPWLMLNRGGLSILVHPETGNDVEDHETNPLWLGTPVTLDIEFLRRLPR